MQRIIRSFKHRTSKQVCAAVFLHDSDALADVKVLLLAHVMAYAVHELATACEVAEYKKCQVSSYSACSRPSILQQSSM